MIDNDDSREFIFGYRLGSLPSALDVLDPDVEPVILRCWQCGELTWFPGWVTRAWRDDQGIELRSDRAAGPEPGVCYYCHDCIAALIELADLPENVRQILRENLDRYDTLIRNRRL